MAVAFIIARVVRLPEAAGQLAADRQEAGVEEKKSEPQGGQFREVIYEEISGIVDSKVKRQEITRTVSHILDKELEDRIRKNIAEFEKKHEKIIQEKTQNEEVALQKYKKVLLEKKNTDAVIRSIAEGLVVVDAEGKVIMVNPAAEKLLGVSKKEKVGTRLAENLRKEHFVSLAKNSPLAGDENREIELKGADDDTKKVLRASSAVIENENGQTVGMVSVLSDITKQKELDALKSKFVASVSHELRTPLIAIDKSISLLLSEATGDVSETQEQFLSIASRNLKRLSSLINDLLDMSKLEAGKMSLDRRPSSIKEVISEVAQSLQNWANTKSIAISLDIQEGIPPVDMDPNRIIQVFNNLVGNSIKFTPQKGTITIKAQRESDTVKIAVSDNGIGVSKEELPKIFDKFYQAEGRSSTDISGTGLGLSIVKEIIELHGGTIRAESKEGQGMRFTFTLPLSA
jgi:PAS domain S-box-containing protein